MDVLGIGTDITECLRIARMIERHGELFISRVYTTEETRYCQSRKAAIQHFTGRWAAKEAILKAVGTGWRRGISWLDMEVLNDVAGKPCVTISGGLREAAQKAGIDEMLVTISHCRTHATAYALALGREPRS